MWVRISTRTKKILFENINNYTTLTSEIYSIKEVEKNQLINKIEKIIRGYNSSILKKYEVMLRESESHDGSLFYCFFLRKSKRLKLH
ncbi:MAG: hypothetical protein QXX38_01535 [Candidatus Aenigmatarchaeota archaeon]